MQVVVTEATLSVNIGCGTATVDPPSTPGTHASELLHVDVDELTGAGAFVAADDAGDGPVHPVEAVHAVTPEHPVDGGTRVPTEYAKRCGPCLVRRRAVSMR
jgi:hypothetical protein